MDSKEEDIDASELPPVCLPEDLPLEVKGFEQELGQKVAEEIITLVREMSRYLPLNNLVGVTVAYDYDAALANIDRGFGGAAPPAQATHDDELGHGTAMAVSVNRDGVWKTHVVFGPYVVGLLASDNKNDKARGYKLVAHELAHAADYEFKRQTLGDIWLKQIDDLIPDAKEEYLWELSHFIWDEYYASRVSVPFDDEDEPYEDELFSKTYVVFRDRFREARREYHWGDITLEEFLEILKHNLRMVLLGAGYLFGLGDGHERDLAEIAPKSAPLLEEEGGRAILRFHEVLLKLWERRGEWVSYNEFLELNDPAEALLNDLDLYVEVTDEGQVYMDIPVRPEHILA